MGNYIINTILLLLVLTGVSCSSNQRDAIEKIHFKTSPEPIPLSRYFSSISTHNLQSDKPIGSIDKIIFTQSNVLVSDFYIMKSLKVFDRHGKLLASRDDIGEGPLGLSEITDYDVLNDTIYVLDAHKRRIYLFSMDLSFLSEYTVPIAANNFIINQKGMFLLRQGENAQKGRILHYSHDMQLIESILPIEEVNTQMVLSNTVFFTKINDSSFVFTNPFFPNLYIYKDGKMEKIELDFNGNFININDLSRMDPLDKLHFVNNYEGFYNLTNGIKLTDTEFLFSIRYRKKDGYLKIDLEGMEMVYVDKIKNDLMKLPSKITFSGNSTSEAWYWINQDELEKFYLLNNSRISQDDRIETSSDKEYKIIFQLDYK